MLRSVLFMLVLAANVAWAGPKEAVHDALHKMLAAKSFRATVSDPAKGEAISAMEFVAPDRYHMRTAKGPDMVIIGDDAWMNIDGRTMKVPMPVGRMVAQYRNERTLRELEAGLSVSDLGSDSVGGQPAHVYHYTVTDPVEADVKLWIDERSGLPLQSESRGSFMGRQSTALVRYSDYNDATIRIEAPQD